MGRGVNILTIKNYDPGWLNKDLALTFLAGTLSDLYKEAPYRDAIPKLQDYLKQSVRKDHPELTREEIEARIQEMIDRKIAELKGTTLEPKKETKTEVQCGPKGPERE